ncbi:hypothetical protein E5Q_04580 [Mixia osmundae IAM 14324]|uniref:Protein BFR2 n=1 Tax=Mixia osmundae (strain CBS 9802 / IAM 14324 / JCM 22182 / KY 12970) TaxID=764103 RepID=G7E4Z0_MIXOS|nr:hypothetical protein E5Q_04580 [Mixia osmundae IAM 14324]
MARKTLVEQLAELNEPLARDFDPEDAETYKPGFLQDVEQDDDQLDRVESPAKSRLRKLDATDDPRYAGRQSSRKAALDYSDDEISSAEASDESQDSEEAEQQSETAHEPVSSDDDVPMQAQVTEQRRPSPVDQGADREILSQLRQAASADVRKGQHVKKQLSLWDSLLELRIRAQKLVLVACTLPSSQDHESFAEANAESRQALSTALKSTADLSDALYDLRVTLLRKNGNIDISAGKRKRSIEDDLAGFLSDSVDNMSMLEERLQTQVRATVTKWHEKVTVATGASQLNGNRFAVKAINQSTMLQVDSAMSQEREKLSKRTRVNRTDSKRLRTSAAESTIDDDIFDDTDFYQALLKEVVEGRSVDLDDPTLGIGRLDEYRKKKTKQVDTKASKGRKLRFHVHDKAVNFMVPIPQGTWQDDQVNELFASLLGQTNGGKALEQPAQAEIGQLRLF